MNESGGNAFLLEYIASYDVYVTATNSLSFVLFGASVFFLSRRLGLVRDAAVGDIQKSWLLWIVLGSCSLTIVANFLLHGELGAFLSDSYRRELSGTIKFRFCDYGSAESPFECFQRLREERIVTRASVSYVMTVISSLVFGVWLTLNLFCMGGRNEDKERSM